MFGTFFEQILALFGLTVYAHSLLQYLKPCEIMDVSGLALLAQFEILGASMRYLPFFGLYFRL